MNIEYEHLHFTFCISLHYYAWNYDRSCVTLSRIDVYSPNKGCLCVNKKQMVSKPTFLF